MVKIVYYRNFSTELSEVSLAGRRIAVYNRRDIRGVRRKADSTSYE